MAASAPQTSTSSEHLCKPRGLGLSSRRYKASARLIQASRPKRHSRSPPPGTSFQPCLQPAPAVTCQDYLLVCRCRIARTGVINDYAQGCLNSPLPRELKAFSGRNYRWNASSHRARAQKLTARAFQIDNRELIVGDVLAIVCFCLYKQVNVLSSLLFIICQLPCIVMPSLRGKPIMARDKLLHAQITALLFLPDFPGWLAPLHFNPGITLPSPMMYA